jgi:hypothetical protein
MAILLFRVPRIPMDASVGMMVTGCNSGMTLQGTFPGIFSKNHTTQLVRSLVTESVINTRDGGICLAPKQGTSCTNSKQKSSRRADRVELLSARICSGSATNSSGDALDSPRRECKHPWHENNRTTP